MFQTGFRKIATILVLSFASLVSTGAANAQDADPNVLAAQMDQMRSEIRFLRSQIDAAAGVGNTFDGLVERVVDLEVSMNSIDQKIARLIDLDSRRARELELSAQKIQALEAAIATLKANGSEQTIIVTQQQSAASTSQDDATSTSEVEEQVAVETPAPRTTQTTVAVSATSIMDGALLNPGPVVAIVTRDDQGTISRPIPSRRPADDLDPQPLSASDFEQVSLAEAQPAVSVPEPIQPDQAGPAVAEEQPAPKTRTAKQVYDEAFAHIETDDLAAAEQGFSNFLQQYPNDPLASNASYWLGESYYGRQMWNESLRAFASSVRDHSDGRKAPDSLLKLGITLATLERPSEACRLLTALPLRYSNAEALILDRARAEAAKLNC